MRNEQVLGWYSLQGTVFISQDIAEDPDRTVSVINHETTHQIISSSTPHGFLQEALELGRDQAWYEAGTSTGDKLRSLMFGACRMLHEATATYCGLVDYEGEDLDRELERLPSFYRQGYDLYDRLFQGRAADALIRYRLARAIGCRAMQTAVLSEWFSKRLWQPESLEQFLSDPLNVPNDRLTKILDVLYTYRTDELAAWCGGHIQSKHSFVLYPDRPPAIAGLQFVSLPTLPEAQTLARDILDILCPGRFGPRKFGQPIPSMEELAEQLKKERESKGSPTLGEEAVNEYSTRVSALLSDGMFATLGHGSQPEVAIQPATFHSVPLGANLEWAQLSDIVLVDRNVFDRPIEQFSSRGKRHVEARSAQLHFFRPDYSAAREQTVPLEGVADFLDLVDPGRPLTICAMGGLSWLPTGGRQHADSGGPLKLDEVFLEWTRGRPTLEYTSGTKFGLGSLCTMLTRLNVPLRMHRMQVGKTWGLLLVRSSTAIWPMGIHPILISEWNRIGNIMYRQHPLERDTPTPVFFNDDARNCIPALNFMRVYQGLTMKDSDWQRFTRVLPQLLLADRHRPVNPHMSGTDFRDAL